MVLEIVRGRYLNAAAQLEVGDCNAVAQLEVGKASMPPLFLAQVKLFKNINTLPKS
jgi:hypothetical protein